MPADIPNSYPFPTATEALEAPGDRVAKGARFVAARHIRGLARRAFIVGENDHAPVLKGVRDLVEKVYALVDSLDATEDPLTGPTLDEEVLSRVALIKTMLEDHGCQEHPSNPPSE